MESPKRSTLGSAGSGGGGRTSQVHSISSGIVTAFPERTGIELMPASTIASRHDHVRLLNRIRGSIRTTDFVLVLMPSLEITRVAGWRQLRPVKKCRAPNACSPRVGKKW